MSRNRKPNRKNRTFQIESLERRELMSATPLTSNVQMGVPADTRQLANQAAQVAPLSGDTARIASSWGIGSQTNPITVRDNGPYYGSYNRPLQISVSALLANDSGANFQIVEGSFESKAKGIVDIRNGLVTYYHPDPAVHEDSFTYTVKYQVKTPTGLSNGSVITERTATAKVSVVISGIPPVADDDTTSDLGQKFYKNKTTKIDGYKVLDNDKDPDGPHQGLKVAEVYATAQTHGRVELLNGQIYYTPDNDYDGPASFKYVVEDPGGLRDAATVSFMVQTVEKAGGGGSPGGTTPNPDNGGISDPGAGGEVVPGTTSGPDFTADVKNGVLTITALQSRAQFVVEQLAKHVKVSAVYTNGGAAFKMYDRRLVKEIKFVGTAGSDRFVNNTDIDATAHGNDGNDTLIGGGGNDKLYGDGGNDVIQGRGGDDRIDGGADNDKLYGGTGNNNIFDEDAKPSSNSGGAGNKPVAEEVVPDPVPEAKLTKGLLVIQGSTAADNVSVSLASGKVVVTFNGRQKQFAASAVNSMSFYGGAGDDKFTNNTSIAATAHGDLGNDKLIGGSGKDELHGGAGNDWIEGSGGNDILHGDDGNDTMQGGAGDDRLFGGNNDDHLDGGAGSDRLEGGAGNDGIYGGDGRDFLFGQEGTDWLYGGFGNDELFGGIGADILHGNEGDDTLDGEDGDDTLYGDNDNDRLVSRDGAAGNDKLFGGVGVNVFDAPAVEIKQG